MVIQRWQSVFLLIAAVMMALFSFCSLGQFQLADYTLDFRSWGIFSEGIPTDGTTSFYQPTIYLCSISWLCTLICLIDIFLYRNLILQKRICAVATLLIIGTGFTAALLGYNCIEGASVRWSSIAFAPFIALAGTILAWRGIKADYKKIKSADRFWD